MGHKMVRLCSQSSSAPTKEDRDSSGWSSSGPVLVQFLQGQHTSHHPVRGLPQQDQRITETQGGRNPNYTLLRSKHSAQAHPTQPQQPGHLLHHRSVSLTCFLLAVSKPLVPAVPRGCVSVTLSAFKGSGSVRHPHRE